MTLYTVVWHEDARDDLARLWMSAEDRNVLARAAHEIDAELAEDPENKGVELSEGLRQLIVAPLRVLFEVHAADRLVEVDRVLRA